MKKLTNEQLRKLCVENNWFTEGTAEQYAKLFYANSNDDFDNEDLARLIWICSEDVTKQEILEKIENK